MKQIKASEVAQGQYFYLNPNGSGFLRDSDGRYVRLWDAAYVDGFFTDSTGLVTPTTREKAVAMSIAYRS